MLYVYQVYSTMFLQVYSIGIVLQTRLTTLTLFPQSAVGISTMLIIVRQAGAAALRF